MNYPDPETVPHTWEVGDVILDKYEVRQIITTGGMGLVYRVYHREWDMDLAVKSPKPQFFQTLQQIENFEKEAETWVNLGMHPHTACCHYIRRLGGIPRIFAEFVEGGTLSDWIRTGKLYEGTREVAIERILDVAIQFAWGLKYAHERGLIHQDVKPGNVLMSSDGIAKVSDFGLSSARRVSAEPATISTHAGQSVLVPGSGFMTREYASPEQFRGDALSKATDIWSWAVSVLEMINQEVSWVDGRAAPHVLSDLSCTMSLPDELIRLLLQALEYEPEQRCASFAEISAKLISIYKQTVGEKYSRIKLDFHDLEWWQEHNRALSLLDIRGKSHESDPDLLIFPFMELVEKWPSLMESHFIIALMSWRNGSATLENAMEYLEAAEGSEAQKKYFIAQLKAESGIIFTTSELIKEIAAVTATDEQPIADDQSLLNPEQRFKTIIKLGDRSAFFETDSKLNNRGYPRSVIAICILADNDTLCLADHNAKIWILSIKQPNTKRFLNTGIKNIIDIVPHPKVNVLAVSGEANHIEIWDCSICEQISQLEHGGNFCASLQFVDTNSILASVGSSIIQWDYLTKQKTQLFETQGEAGTIVGLVYDSINNSVIAFCSKRNLHEWKADGTYINYQNIFKGQRELDLPASVKLSICRNPAKARKIIMSIAKSVGVCDLETESFHPLESIGLIPFHVESLAISLRHDRVSLVNIFINEKTDANAKYFDVDRSHFQLPGEVKATFETIGSNAQGSIIACTAETYVPTTTRDLLGYYINTFDSSETYVYVYDFIESELPIFKSASLPVIQPQNLIGYFAQKKLVNNILIQAKYLSSNGKSAEAICLLDKTLKMPGLSFDANILFVRREIGKVLAKKSVLTIDLICNKRFMDRSNYLEYAYFPTNNTLWFHCLRAITQLNLTTRETNCLGVDHWGELLHNFVLRYSSFVGYDPVNNLLFCGDNALVDFKANEPYIYNCFLAPLHRAISDGTISMLNLFNQSNHNNSVTPSEKKGVHKSITFKQFQFGFLNESSIVRDHNSLILVQPGILVLDDDGVFEYIESISLLNSIVSFDRQIRRFAVNPTGYEVCFLDDNGMCTIARLPDKLVLWEIDIKKHYTGVGKPKLVQYSLDQRMILVGHENFLFYSKLLP
jgi:serine/threonine protein kinase